jgi:hypothetical protein
MLRVTQKPTARKDASMFETAEELSEKLSEIGYFIDPTMTKVVFLAARMQ